uniref:Protein kinase domain-containing protein n=1 Tax=Kalanchoe fedtschenkoi TaxID=63787 RepID=A0A7N0TM96_KALFE
MVGFSAATTHILEQHTLYSWEFSSSLDIKEIKEEKSKSAKLIVGLVVPFGFLFIGGILAYVIFRRPRPEKTTETVNLTSMNDDLERSAGPRRFSYMDLAYATNNFSSQRKLGEGGFGSVFRGYLNELDMPVAVKKISQGSRQGKKEYMTEVKVISSLRHRNLVQLIGWCHDKGEFLLVYEFMPNGSLDLHLFGKMKPLSWAVRFKIVQGLASGLLYLHEEWEQCVIHRDIKPNNIMLDSSFTVKLGDFGLAKLINHEVGPQKTGLAGTFGYMAPEYVTTGRASKESDVFSFGVVALETATGKRAVDPGKESSQLGLVHWVWGLYGQGDLKSGIDEALSMDCDINQIERLMIVGLWCAHPDYRLRPSIRQAIHVLDLQVPLPVLPAEMPVATYGAPNPRTPGMSSGEPSLTYTSLNVGR